jgi:putative ABC transport system permease protein
VGPDYFQTLGLTIVHGREFSGAGGDGSGGTVVVNERFVEQFFAGRDPIGQRVTLSPEDGPPVPARWLTIVGVAPNLRQRRPPEPEAIVYTSYESAPSASAAIVVRGNRTPEELARSLKEEVRALDPSLPVDRVRTMRDVVREAGWVGRLSATLFLTLMGIAVGLSVLGVYAVAAHGVTRRTHEIGVRLALGASKLAVVWMILRSGLQQVAAGFVVGIGCTVVWEHLFSSGDAAVRATDPRSLALVAGTLVLLTCAACAVPAMRATRLDPLVAIRHE